MRVREAVYRRGLIRSARLSVPVISIGNLTLGGSGKTPLVIHLARQLRHRGYHPAVISRGYRGTARGPVNVVSHGQTPLLDPAAAGDEPWLIAHNLEAVPVLTGRRRAQPCHYAIDNTGSDLLLLDDGFQHLAVQRDLDLVLFNADFFAGNSRVFPGGDLREPVTALRRCDAFVITGVSGRNRDRSEKCRRLLQEKFPEKPCFLSFNHYRAMNCYDPVIGNRPPRSISLKSGLPPLYGFCAIANPNRFFKDIEANDIKLTGFECFRDHHSFSDRELARLCEKACHSGAEALLTTEKDLVRLFKRPAMTLPIFTLPLEAEPEPELLEFILDRLAPFAEPEGESGSPWSGPFTHGMCEFKHN